MTDRDAERTATVAWLRQHAEGDHIESFTYAALCIESGDHVQPELTPSTGDLNGTDTNAYHSTNAGDN